MAQNQPYEPDPLTGLPGRAAFLADLDAALRATRRTGRQACIALCDLDRFAALNDEYGVAAGDDALKQAARILREAVPEDAAGLYRFGGDAFMLLWSGEEKEQAFLAMEQARRRLDAPLLVHADGKPLDLPLTLSIGIAAYPDDADNAAELVNKVNEAMYRAKATGPNKVCLSREERMTTKTSHYTQGQLQGLQRLAKRKGVGEAVLLREALNDLLRKHNA